ncbi:MAG: prepilin-type N-terminal cleavage/methylation domain-containing protein [Planctomycetota bacterium]
MNEMKGAGRGGFTFIEMMIVIVVLAVLIVAMMFVLFRPRMIANETAALEALRSLITAQNQYATGNGGRFAALTELSASTPPYIDVTIGRGRKSGYCFLVRPSPDRLNWSAQASPTAFGKTGARYFYVGEEGTVRFNLVQPATSRDPPSQ